jgi:hypothetical protein
MMDYAVIPQKISNFCRQLSDSTSVEVCDLEFAANLAKRPASNRGVYESRRGHPWNYILAVVSHIQDL